MTQEVPSEGRLFLAVLGVLDRRGCRHLLIRNYQGYPFEFTGDVDIYVELEKLYGAERELMQACTDSGWEVMKLIARPWVLALQCIRKSAGEERSVLVIELFDRFTWLRFPYADFESIWSAGTVRGNMRVVSEAMGMVLTLAHYLYWAGFFPSKYQARLVAAARSDGFEEAFNSVFTGSLRASVSGWLHRYMVAGEAEWERRPNVPEHVLNVGRNLHWGSRRIVVLRAGQQSWLRTMRHLAELVGMRVRELIYLSGAVLLVEDRAWDLLRTVKKFHLLKNRTSATLSLTGTGLVAALRALPKAYWVVVRGGVCVIELPPHADSARRLLQRVFGDHAKMLPRFGDAAESELLDSAIKALR